MAAAMAAVTAHHPHEDETMDLDTLKGKTLDDELLAKLKADREKIIGQRDSATKESINQRQKIKAENEALRSENSLLREKLGVDDGDDITQIPNAKGQAEARAQFEAQLKRLTREKEATAKELADLKSEVVQQRRDRAIESALDRHNFIDKALVKQLAVLQVQQEGDDFLFRTDEGRLVPIEEGVAWMAKSKTFLVNPAGPAGGQAAGGAPAGGPAMGAFTGVPHGAGQPQVNPWDPKSFNLTKQIELSRENPTLAAQLKAAAGPA